MRTDIGAPVTMADGLSVVEQLRDLHARAEENGQTMFSFVFDLAAESLAENLGNAADIDDEDMGAADAHV